MRVYIILGATIRLHTSLASVLNKSSIITAESLGLSFPKIILRCLLLRFLYLSECLNFSTKKDIEYFLHMCICHGISSIISNFQYLFFLPFSFLLQAIMITCSQIKTIFKLQNIPACSFVMSSNKLQFTNYSHLLDRLLIIL